MRLKPVLFLILISLIPAACGGRISQQSDSADVQMDVSADSMSVGETTLTVTLQEPDGAPIENADLAVKGDMTHAGMTPVLADVSGGPGGVYTVPFSWTMGGDWIVTVEATLPDGRTASQTFDMTVSGDMEMDMDEEMDMEMEQ